jgi:hypothetical protein
MKHGSIPANDEVSYDEQFAVASFGGTIPAGWSDYTVMAYTCPFNAAFVAVTWLVRMNWTGAYLQVAAMLSSTSTPPPDGTMQMNIVDDVPGSTFANSVDIPVTGYWVNVSKGTSMTMRIRVYGGTSGVYLQYVGGFIRSTRR